MTRPCTEAFHWPQLWSATPLQRTQTDLTNPRRNPAQRILGGFLNIGHRGLGARVAVAVQSIELNPKIFNCQTIDCQTHFFAHSGLRDAHFWRSFSG